MPTLRQMNRAFVRAALLWALVGGVLFLARAASEVMKVPWGTQAGKSALSAIILGFFGNLWVSTVYTLSSSLPSSKPAPLKSASFVLPLWQIGTASAAASAFAIYRQIPGYSYPVLTLTAATGYLSFVTGRSIQTRVAEPSAAHWTNLVACLEAFFGTLLISLTPARDGLEVLGVVGVAFFALGWAYHAALVLFVGALELEPYDDQKPVYVAFGASLVMVLIVFLGPGAQIIASFAQLAYVLSLAFLLQKRWYGKFFFWEERFLMAGVVASFFGLSSTSVSGIERYFVALGLAAESGSKPYLLIASGVLVLPLAFGAAYGVKQCSRGLGSGMCRLVIASVIAAVFPQFIMSLAYFDPNQRYDLLIVRALFAASEVVVAAGLVVMASLARGLGRRRADLRPV